MYGHATRHTEQRLGSRASASAALARRNNRYASAATQHGSTHGRREDSNTTRHCGTYIKSRRASDAADAATACMAAMLSTCTNPRPAGDHPHAAERQRVPGGRPRSPAAAEHVPVASARRGADAPASCSTPKRRTQISPDLTQQKRGAGWAGREHTRSARPHSAEFKVPQVTSTGLELTRPSAAGCADASCEKLAGCRKPDRGS